MTMTRHLAKAGGSHREGEGGMRLAAQAAGVRDRDLTCHAGAGPRLVSSSPVKEPEDHRAVAVPRHDDTPDKTVIPVRTGSRD